MIAIQIITRSNTKKVVRRAKRGQLSSIYNASGFTRKTMQRTVRKNKKPRSPGKAVTSPTHQAYNSILFDVNKRDQDSVIGPSARIVGSVMGLHERGGRRGKNKYRARPFAGPSFDKVTPKLAQFWRGSVSQ